MSFRVTMLPHEPAEPGTHVLRLLWLTMVCVDIVCAMKTSFVFLIGNNFVALLLGAYEFGFVRKSALYAASYLAVPSFVLQMLRLAEELSDALRRPGNTVVFLSLSLAMAVFWVARLILVLMLYERHSDHVHSHERT